MDRKEHWEKIYREKKPTDVSWYQKDPARSLAWIRESAASMDAAVVDVGGGASLLVDRLLDLGYRNVTLLDISGSALATVRTRLGNRAALVRFVEADVTRCDADLTCVLWHDRAVFHFLTEAEDRGRYIELLRQSLRPGGRLILSAFAPDGPEKCSGLPVRRYDASLIGAELGAEFELLRQESELHRTPADKEQRFRHFLFERTGGTT